jgi:single-strand DNA-binding protein
MISSRNMAVLRGNLVADPEVRTFSSGGQVTNFRMAVNRRFKDKDTGQWESRGVFLDCKAFSKVGEAIAAKFHKGQPITIIASLDQDEWNDKQTGAKRSKLVFCVENYEFVDGYDYGNGPGKKDDAGEAPPTENIPY